MTKIKNTKKGMAKKTLSVSLAVAMLATSNVPVWAAEFSDGTEAAFTAEVEAPVVEAEAPVVEDNTEDVPEAQAEEGAYNFKNVKYDTNFDWGKNTSPFKSGSQVTFIAEDGSEKDALAEGHLGYVYLLDGKEVTGYVNRTLTTALNSNILTKDAVGKTLTARFYRIDLEEDGSIAWIDRNQLMGEINFGTIQAKQVNTVASASVSGGPFGYTGQVSDASKVPTVTGGEFTATDFNWSYTGSNGANVGTVTVTGTL